ncbi:MAG: bifunctional (p)ppGpp synthetase/guanosine-3',5'-bis(diphosphate) 3'-pyrophosphohydrolase [Pseudomonadota bacterium]
MQTQAIFSPQKLRTVEHREAWTWVVEAAQRAQIDAPCISEIAATLQGLDAEDSVILAGVYFYARRAGVRVGDMSGQMRILVQAADHFETLKGKLPIPHDILNVHLDSAQPMMMLEALGDMRAIFVLLAERLCVLRHLKGADEALQQRLARETFALHVPIANRLGVGNLKWELEDQAFRYLSPAVYKEIATHLEERRADREQYITQVVTTIKSALSEAGIDAEVYGRPKHIYSIWRKMQRKEQSFYDLYDVRAVRILVDSVEQCYSALSVVHNLWQYIPGEYDDYIAAPKANHYQSLHTAVAGPQQKNVEVQIRTRTMHRYAENGLAAHWRYKEGASEPEEAQRIDWLRTIVQQTAMYESDTPIESAPNKVYVLSPKGKVLDLPLGATPLDYAYHIHTDLGHRCRGAKVNGKMAPLTTALKSGQEVEIITGKEVQPSRDWLLPNAKYLVSNRARSKVRQWFKTQFRAEHMTHGKSMLARELARLRLDAIDIDSLARRFNLTSADDLYAALGRGDLGALQVSHALMERAPVVSPHPPVMRPSDTPSLDILGVHNLLTNVAHCCKPLPGDVVRGFITKGRGVVLHRKICTNLRRLAEKYPDRIVDVNWAAGATERYDADIALDAFDRAGLLRDVTAAISAADINVMAAHTYTDRHTSQAHMTLTVQVQNRTQLQHVLDKIVQVKGVLEVRRVE